MKDISKFRRWCLLATFASLMVACGSKASAQRLLPLAGTHFTFAVIEGPDSLGSSSQVLVSDLLLSIVSDKAGCGIVRSPNGFFQTFSFDGKNVTQIHLDHGLMLLSDLGKSNKGLLVTTTAPVVLNLHDYAPAAGDATQLLPDNALDTSYIIAAWGIRNDPTEDNHSEFVVTATTDSTSVTITPTVRTLLQQPAGVPFTVQLNRGECYIVKADIRDNPASTSLVESTVSATSPVSVITGVSCAYVPLQLESCNEIMDELIPRSAWGTEFYARNLSPFNDEDILVVTSDVKSYYVIAAGGITYFTTNGHLEIPFAKATHYTSSVPVQCHEISEGSSTVFFGASDPSLVTLLPIQQFRDTLLWSTPSYDFPDHYINLIYPTASQQQVLLDGVPITSLGVIEPIRASTMSTASIGIRPGRHTVTAPQPVFGIAAGFGSADAYTIMAGSVAQAPAMIVKLANLRGVLDPLDTESYCRQFSINVKTDSAYVAGDNIAEFSCDLKYDATRLLLVRLQPLAPFTGFQYTVDSSIKGDVLIQVRAPAEAELLLNRGDLFRATFLAIDKSLQKTEVVFNYLASSIFGCLSPARSSDSLLIQPIAIVDTMRVPLQVAAGSAILGKMDTATISVGALDATLGVRAFDLYLVYDHDILTYSSADLFGLPTNGWTVSQVTPIDKQTDKISFSTLGAPLIGPATIARIYFTSYVSDSSSALIRASSSFSNARFCPLALYGKEASGLFLGKDLCGDPELHQAMGVNGLRITGIVPNPSAGRLQVGIEIPQQEMGSLQVIDLLGRSVWNSAELRLQKGANWVSCDLQGLPSGRYVLRIKSDLGATSRMIEVIH